MTTEALSIQSLDAAMLTPLARKASRRDDLKLENWQAQAVTGGAEQGSSLQRISGTGTSAGQAVSWSMVLKTITPGPRNSGSPQASHYWLREPAFYQSGILADLPAGFRSPICFGVIEHERSAQLFLEDLRDPFYGEGSAQAWPLELYRPAARCLGRFNGAYLGSKQIPGAEWIPRRWLRAYVGESAPNIERFEQSAGLPIVKQAFGGVSTGLILQAWEQRGEVLDALDRLPQVFCHQDAFVGNLFVESSVVGEVNLAAVDWSYAGPGAMGTELAPLVWAGIGLGKNPAAEGSQIAHESLEGYQQGLADAGWHGSPDLVLFGFSACCFWRYFIGAMIGECLELLANEAYYPLIEQATRKSIEQIADQTAELMNWTFPYYAESLRLRKKLNL